MGFISTYVPLVISLPEHQFQYVHGFGLFLETHKEPLCNVHHSYIKSDLLSPGVVRFQLVFPAPAMQELPAPCCMPVWQGDPFLLGHRAHPGGE